MDFLSCRASALFFIRFDGELFMPFLEGRRPGSHQPGAPRQVYREKGLPRTESPIHRNAAPCLVFRVDIAAK